MKRWKAIYVNSRAEKKVAAQLQEKNIEAYVPLKTEIRQWSDRKKKVITPLINGYVFVKPTPQQRDEVFKTDGVIHYVRYNGTDAIIRDSEIDILRMIELKGYHVDGKFGIDLNAGDLVEIKEGPFKGFEGLITRHKNESTCLLAIKSIDFQLQVLLPKEVLKKVN
jgi:transcription antitermination factor NusG